MLTLRRGISLLALLLCVAAAGPTMAAPYDAPAIQSVDASRASLTLRVTAGASGAPAGYLVQWMTSYDYYAYGWDDAYAYTCFCWGTPTWNYEVAGGTYTLAPGASQVVEMGDLHDETGVTANYSDELARNEEYYFRVRAVGDANGEDSPWSASIEAITDDDDNCTYTQGYWKTHPEAWPVGSLTLGTVNYTAAELLQILNTPAGGNGLLILAHQLIATKLNVASGADPSPVAAQIAAADALIGNLVVPPIGAGFLAPSQVTATSLALDNYNNGNTSVPHCGETPSRAASWGRLKALYR